MPLQYKPTPHAYYTVGDSLTEQEHKDSCDVNKMIRDAARGLDIRGSSSPQVYGDDDTTMDGLSHRIKKQQLEADLAEIAKTTEFTEEELKVIPDSIKQKFKFKTKQKAKNTNDDKNKTNDDKNSGQNVKNEPSSVQNNASSVGKADGPPLKTS